MVGEVQEGGLSVWKKIKSVALAVFGVVGILIGILSRLRRPGSTGGLVPGARDTVAGDREAVESAKRGINDSQERVTIVEGRIERSTEYLESAIGRGRTVGDILAEIRAQGKPVEDPDDSVG